MLTRRNLIGATGALAALPAFSFGRQDPSTPAQGASHAQLFPNDTLSYEAMRALGYVPVGGGDVMEILQALDGVDPNNVIETWYTAFNTLAQRVEGYAADSAGKGHHVSASQAYLKASMYHRSSGFFLTITPNDPRQMTAYDSSVACFQKAMPWFPTKVEAVEIPYEGTTMNGYFARGVGSGKQPLVILHTGFDGIAEEIYLCAIGFIQRGYSCLIFDGPGQGGTLRKKGLLFRPDWEVPVKAVVEYAKKLKDVDMSRLALVGYSFGGYLAPRAAAFVDEIKVCVADGGVYSMYDSTMANMAPAMGQLLVSDPDKFNTYFLEGVEKDIGSKWGLYNGLYTFGAKTPAEWATMLKAYTLANGVAEKIKATTLVTYGEGDNMMGDVAKPLYDHLTCPKTWMVYTTESGGQLHCQVGGQIYANGTIGDWVDEQVKR